MRANENTAIVGDRVVLVPYRKEHVAKYHEWMSNPDLQELTASEPLSLAEEYEMQQNWQVDEDKLTFIICVPNASSPGGAQVPTGVEPDALTMIGDVNMFLKGPADDPEFEVEVEIMIAEPGFRRRGLALAALELMLSYATAPESPKPLPIPRERLVVRIGDKNEASKKLFEKLGFRITKRVDVFQEIEMRFEPQSHPGSWKAGEIRPLARS